ncbi:hypothetical protein CPB86DRAFT_770310 [Serendipita vermifera]|nr:hypothetical protein CPB86DRAFT_770310 [Serendipita vermifera]
MSLVVLKDARIELSSRDYLLKEAGNLILEITVDGQVVDKMNLLSREADPLVWEADQILAIPGIAIELVISVVMEVDKDKRQMIAFIELNGTQLCNDTESELELPLVSHESSPNFVLKARTTVIENFVELIKSMGLINDQGELLPSAVIESMLARAGIALQDFQRYGKLESLEQAISQYRTAIERIPEDHPKRFAALNDLGTSFLRRFEHVGHLGDINDAIEKFRMAIMLRRDGDAACLTNLGCALFARFGTLQDLDEAIQQNQMALNCVSEGTFDHTASLTNLGTSLRVRFQRLGNLEDLESSTAQLLKAVDLTPNTDPNKYMSLMNLGNTFIIRFERFGNVVDIDNAITQMQMALDLTANDHPDKPCCLSNLGISFQTRFERLENPVDLDEAIVLQQQAVTLTTDSHPSKANYSNNLARVLYLRFRRTRSGADINDAIFWHQKAVDLTPGDSPDKALRLNTFASSLSSRFKIFGNTDDINNAIKKQLTVLDLTPDNHPSKSSYFYNLANYFDYRFLRFKNPDDLESSIIYWQKALELTPSSHPDRCDSSFNLGMSFMSRFLRSFDPHDAEVARLYLSSAATSPDGLPKTRFEAAEGWAHLAALSGDNDSPLVAYKCAIDLMPVVAWLGLPIADRYRHLNQASEITRDAVAAAISSGQYDTAVEWLEQGRSIVWTQILQLRTPVDQLHNVNPSLADRLLQVSRLLHREPHEVSLYDKFLSTADNDGRQYRALTAERESIIKQVRSIPEFANFLQPANWSQLKAAARNGPIVILNIADIRCDALALLPAREDVVHIPLPSLSAAGVARLRDGLKDQLFSSGIRMRGARAARKVQDEVDDNCERVLAELWTDLVKPILDALEFHPHPDLLPRIWWCATGPLAFLPIHAAGLYSPNSGEAQLSNYAISSYTPTLSALLEPIKSTVASPFDMLSVIQSSAPGAPSIPNTQQELETIRHHLGGRNHVVLEGPVGTRKRVMERMKECSWLHLACHGTQVPEEPTKSALLLEDGRLTLEEITKLDLPQAEFAFLSACQTTTGDETLSEEAVHVAGGMLLAGYRGVVATMWSIQDELAPIVTDEFYGHIMEGGERPDPRKAAEALHLSVQKLRKKAGVKLTDWIPFVHLGI